MNRFRHFITNYQFSLLAWLLIAILVIAGFHFGVDKKVIAFVVLLVGIIGQAFAALIAWIALIPIAGPILAQVLSMPFVWTLNGIGYLLSISAIKRGYSKDVIISSTLAYLAFTLSAEPRHHLVLSGGDRTPDTRIEEIYAPFDTLRTDLEGAGIIETHDLQPGPHELTIHAFDLSGNQSVLRVTLMISK